ncbi:hypothetical protein PMI01_01452 [Caulobacter sp. AP07]|uniref:hypothetical protein n=1 Tax=Caulobacter sp. AP07 TaxID=1144304 RepID=UPI0002720BCD|nr:hypothetical protein [Caulobacter sp. AP07]EJL34759.1 hypothetical protein PMI01_01452 [Caulobacter sp. AP07]
MKTSSIGSTLALAAIALTLGACVSVTSAPAGAYKVGASQVTLGHEWSDISAIMYQRPAKVRLLSMDGPLLNRLYVTDGLAPGEFMVKPLAKERPTPTYRAGMAPNELVEFVSDSVAALDYQRVETEDLRPAKFAGGDGLRFDLKAKSKEGLDVSGTALVAEKAGKLYVVLYIAPTEHYYAVELPEVETVIGSVKPAA